jgi:predicted nucleotide-binding protein
MPFHVRITRIKHRTAGDELALDLDEGTLVARFVEPYLRGRPITTGGTTIAAADVERIRINRTDQSAAALIPVIQAERRSSRVLVPISDEWYVTEKGDDVTDRFITGPAGSVAEAAFEESGSDVPSGLRRIFVVYGRNLRARDAMFAFLRALGLEPLEWGQLVAETTTGTPYVGDVLDAGFATAAGVVVLLTPDDEARLRSSLREPVEPTHESKLTGQARPNVLFEAGIAFGRHPKRTIIVELGALRPFSDLGGRHTIVLNNTSQRRQALADRLAGLTSAVVLTGKTDWHTAGDFDAALA